VPNSPGFPSCPCAISDASSAHLPSPGNAVRFRTPPGADLHRFIVNRVWLGCPSSRVRVAQLRELAVARSRSGSKGGCHLLAPISAAPTIFLQYAAKAMYEGLATLRVSFDMCVFCSLAVCAMPSLGKCIAQTTVLAKLPNSRPVACPQIIVDLFMYSVSCFARNINMCCFAAPHYIAKMRTFLPIRSVPIFF
jgi:hypothetical protein